MCEVLFISSVISGLSAAVLAIVLYQTEKP